MLVTNMQYLVQPKKSGICDFHVDAKWVDTNGVSHLYDSFYPIDRENLLVTLAWLSHHKIGSNCGASDYAWRQLFDNYVQPKDNFYTHECLITLGWGLKAYDESSVTPTHVRIDEATWTKVGIHGGSLRTNLLDLAKDLCQF